MDSHEIEEVAAVSTNDVLYTGWHFEVLDCEAFPSKAVRGTAVARPPRWNARC